MGTVYVDYQGRDAVPAMVIGGMTVVERVLREAAKAGASRAIVRAAGLPALPPLALAVEVVPPATPPPPEATPIAGDIIAGVQICDDRSRRAAAKALFQSCRRPHDGLGDRYVIRAISLRITSLLCRLGATPNQVTWGNIVVGLVAAAVVLRGTYPAFAIGGALMFLQVVLDSSDGELARIRHLHSRFGMWLDNVSDDLIDNLFLAALAIGIGGIWLPIGVGAAAARSACAVMIHVDVARRGKPGDVMSFKWFFDTAGEDLADRFDTSQSVAGVARAFGRRDLYVLVYAATCIAGVPVAGLVLGIALSLAYFVLGVAHVVVSARR